MPGIYAIRCDTCDYHHEGSSSTWVVLDDGSEKCCGHPLERSIAEESTGRAWSALVRARRIRYKHAYFCGACGACADYDGAPGATHIGSIVHQPTPAEAKTLRCSTCGAVQLHPIATPSSALGCGTISAAAALVLVGSDLAFYAASSVERAAGALVAASGLALGAHFVRAIGRKEPPITCPQCKRGTLERRLVAVS